MIIQKSPQPLSAKQWLLRRITDVMRTPGRIFLRSLLSSSPWSMGLKALGCIVILAAFWAEFWSAPNGPSSNNFSNNFSSSSSSSSSSNRSGKHGPIRIGAAVTQGNEPVAFRAPIDQVLAPGELPGYTGWARPERTLARFFSIASIEGDTGSPTHKAYECVVRVRCAGHRDCFGKRKYKDKRKRKRKRNAKNNGGSGSGSGGNDDDDDDDDDDDGGGGPSLFYLRAYGPAVVAGTVAARSCSNTAMGNTAMGSDAAEESFETAGCTYDFRFVFYDPGLYTMEAVLTFSNPPPVSVFPLSQEANEQEPHYEGYLLPGFPLLANVVLEGEEQSPKDDDNDDNDDDDNSQPLCSFEDLTETSTTSARDKARWKVTGRVNGRGYSSDTMNSPIVSKAGFKNNANALGIRMEYKHTNRCRIILPESSFRNDDDEAREEAFPGKACGNGPRKIHIVYIGDSVMRVQKDVLQDLVKTLPKEDALELEFSFLSLHGGYRKNQVLGPANLEAFLSDLQRKAEADVRGGKEDVKIAVLFNTGLHDIHRLCGSEFQNERPSYLDKNSLADGSAFACANEYEALLRDFLDLMTEFPAALKVFQTTTSAWPKYGNFGIQWSEGAQDMPLVSDFSAAFNEIAFDVLAEYRGEPQTNSKNKNNNKNNNNNNKNSSHGSSRIEIMDGYWITHPRPDNRETGDIGKKLSHPGLEVLSTMARMWWMLIRERVCQTPS